MNAGESTARQSRSLRRVGWPALLGLALASTPGCFVDVNLGESRLKCGEDGLCPDGFECIEFRCVLDGQGGVRDASAEDIDAAPAPIDAAPLPDAAPPDGPVELACDEQYGGAPAYQLCSQQPGSCEFFLFSDVAAPCDEQCQAIGGGECITSFDADPDPTPKTDRCTRQEETSCQEMVNLSKICVCSRSPAR